MGEKLLWLCLWRKGCVLSGVGAVYGCVCIWLLIELLVLYLLARNFCYLFLAP